MGMAIGLTVALGGCGDGKAPLPAACVASRATLEHALAAAPGPVRLPGGTPISTCVERTDDSSIQVVGTVLSVTADHLAARAVADPAIALDLGYLVGAVRRGAARTNGLAGQLQQRIGAAAALRGAGPGPLAALHRGIGAGQTSG